MTLHVKVLTQGDMANFDDLYAIYALSFPHSEQKSRDALIKMLHSPAYTFYIACNDEKNLGFCVMYHPLNEDFFLLEYMAINEEQRGLGVGSFLLRHSIEQLFSTQGTRALLVEIEASSSSTKKPNVNQKRELFYRGLGFLKIDPFNYILPLKSDEMPPPMKLLVYYPQVSSLSKKMLHLWILKLYVDVYESSCDDIRISQMFHNTPSTLTLI